ncbi:MAG: hypothetical protein EOP22_00375 [Hyphomicrobiales bacterium]|nr:MAG: hypothetical protein EOP22_00375 [Hyphomicrobiales bacterium]
MARGNDLLERMRTLDVATTVGAADSALLAEWQRSGVKFAASTPQMEAQYYRAVRELLGCIRPAAGGAPILYEGGVYNGCWLESTGTINAELLARFMPDVAQRTFAAFAAHQRTDGCLPYKVTPEGPVFSQIQLVSPLARSVWTHYRLSGDRDFLGTMYKAMARYDEWLATWRNTRGTGGVEAFCTYDTGHDLSARFWHIPDSPQNNDPTRYNADNPLLPLVAPDLTANVACQRSYLALIAEELGEDGALWRGKAQASVDALFANCFDADDGFFYDLDRNGNFIRVQSDVLLRVLACEIGDDDFFAEALQRYLLNTRKFFARFPFTSIALDDPRYDAAFDYNSWSGPTNFLSLIRAPHAFEAHHRHVELSWVIHPILSALFRAPRFAQTLSPFTGDAGYTEQYSPSLLCLLDYIERLSGIMPRPDQTLWFTGLVPQQIEHRDAQHETAYSRVVDGVTFELANSASASTAWRDGQLLFAVPRGARIVTSRRGDIVSLIGMSVRDVEGVLTLPAGDIPFRIASNEQLDFNNGRFVSVRKPGIVPPST